METQAITLRAATAEDAGAIARIHVETWRAAYRALLPEDEIASITVEQRERFWQGVFSRPGGWRVHVATDAAGVIGFCSCGPTRDADDGQAEIYALYVRPEKWRHGAGRLLCEQAVSDAAERGHNAMTLWVLKGNAPARGFYERLGFAPDGAERTNTRFLKTPFDEIRYRKAFG